MEDRERIEEEEVQETRQRKPMELFGEVMFGEAPGEFSVPGPEDQTRAQEIQEATVPRVGHSFRDQVDRRADAPDASEGWERARDAEWIGNLVAAQRRFAPDPDFEWNDENAKELTEGLGEDGIDYVLEAGSADEAEWRRKRYLQDQENEEKLAAMGWDGTWLRLGAAFTDPVVWGASLGASAATGPGGIVGTAANRLTRAQRIIRGGLSGAAGNVAVEAAIKANKPIYDDMNLLYAAGLGFGIGGGLSALSRNPSTLQEAETLRRGGQALAREAEAETVRVTENALNLRVKDGKPFPSRQAVLNSRRYRDTPDAEPVEIREGEWAWRLKTPEEGGSSGDAGAARTSRVQPLGPEHADPDDFIELARKDKTVAPQTAFGTVGGWVSSVSRMKSSKNPLTRAFGSRGAEDAVGNLDRTIAQETPASQKQLRTQRINEMKWGRGWKVNLRKHMEDTGQGRWKPWEKPAREREFGQMVSDYVEGVRTDVPPAVKAQGDILRDIFEDYRVHLNQPGARRQEFQRAPDGWGLRESDPNYLPHEFDYDAFNRLVREHGTGNVEDLFARAIRDASEDGITNAAARRAAQAYVKTVRGLRVGIGGDAGRILGSGDAEEIKRFLRDQSELSPHEIEDMVNALTTRKSGKGKGAKHSKRRTPLNMDTELELGFNPETTGQGSRRVNIREFFNRDAHDLFTKYNRRMSGELAMAQMRIPGMADGIMNNTEWETLKTRVREIGERVGQTPKEIADDLAQMEYIWRSVKGIPNEAAMSRGGQFLRRVRDWNFMRVMGQVGFAQLPEIGVAATGIGLKASLQAVPGFRTLWRNAETGKIDNALVDELELATGFGGDWLRMQHVNRFEDVTNAMDTPMGGRASQAYENFTREGKRAVFAGSGMGAVNTFSQRFALAGTAHRFANMALGKSKSLSPQRLRAMGLSEAKTESILDNIRRHASFEEGLNGQRLKKLNLKDWDLATSADFEEALHSYTRRLIQENDPGQFRPIMANPLAQTILQFRTFIMGAHTKALLHNIHMRDFQAFTTFTVSSMIGAMGYMAYTVSNAQGRSDKAEYLKERLTHENVAKAAFERSSWAALVPTAIDTAAMPFTDPIFDFRTTGQSTDILFGNPSSDLLDSASKGIGALTRPVAEGRAPAQDEIRAGLRMMPFQNLHGVTQMTNLLLGESGLPERAPRN